MAKDKSKICVHAVTVGRTVKNLPAYDDKPARLVTVPRQKCQMKNIDLSNTICGQCNTFRHIDEKRQVEEAEKIEAIK